MGIDAEGLDAFGEDWTDDFGGGIPDGSVWDISGVLSDDTRDDTPVHPIDLRRPRPGDAEMVPGDPASVFPNDGAGRCSRCGHAREGVLPAGWGNSLRRLVGRVVLPSRCAADWRSDAWATGIQCCCTDPVHSEAVAAGVTRRNFR